MSKFSEELINITEAAIISDKLVPKDCDNVPAISCSDYYTAETGWKIINKCDKNYYLQFGSNAGGFTSYGFYKANNGQIYIIEAWVNEIKKVYVPTKNWDCLTNFILDDDIN